MVVVVVKLAHLVVMRFVDLLYNLMNVVYVMVVVLLMVNVTVLVIL